MPDDTALAYGQRGPEHHYRLLPCGYLQHHCTGKRVTGEMRTHSILGGFHLMEPTSEQLRRTADFLAENRGIERYPCHCTCFAAKAAIPRHIPVREIGSGTVLEWE